MLIRGYTKSQFSKSIFHFLTSVVFMVVKVDYRVVLRLVKWNKLLIWSFVLASVASCRPEPQPQPWNSLTDVVDPEDLLLYEVNPRAHSAAGTIAGITADLDRIKSLNVNTIWLMPVFKMGQLKSVGSPYCVADYRAIDPEFGTLDDTDFGLAQFVSITDESGQKWTALYTVEKQKDGSWKISGCRILKEPGTVS